MNQLQQIEYPLSPALPGSVNSGSVAIEQQRAIAEVHGKIFIAKSFPRNLAAAHAELTSACQLPELAAVAFYNVPRAGGTVSGPSIRLAEEIARIYGHFDYGHRELSRDSEKSEVEVYAWDMQNNNFSRRQITVMHTIDKKVNGVMTTVKLTSQKDIDDKIANVASKQMRGRILALLPKWMVAGAIEMCKQTLLGGGKEPIEARVRKMVAKFAVFGVTVQMLEDHLKHPLSNVTADELVDLIGVYNSLNEGGIKASEFFSAVKDEQEAPTSQTIASLNQQAAAAGGAVANDNKQPRQTKRKAEPVIEQQAAPEPEQEQYSQADIPQDLPVDNPFDDL